MKFLATSLLLSASVLFGQSAADPFASKLHGIEILASGTVTVPAEWAGIWTTEDSTYDCTTGFKSTLSGSDTLCADKRIFGDPSVTCMGSADATSYDVTCTGSGDVSPDCHYSITIASHGTRTGDSFFSVSTTTLTFSGTQIGCDGMICT